MADDIGGMRKLEALAESAYDAIYDTRDKSGAAACYSEAKERFREAISVARRIGADDHAARLEARLAHVKAVFRSQFT